MSTAATPRVARPTNEQLSKQLMECAFLVKKGQKAPIMNQTIHDLMEFMADGSASSNASSSNGDRRNHQESTVSRPINTTLASFTKKIVGAGPHAHEGRSEVSKKATSTKNAARVVADIEQQQTHGNAGKSKRLLGRHHDNEEWCDVHFCKGCSCKELDTKKPATRQQTNDSPTSPQSRSKLPVKPGFQRPTNPRSSLIANGWIEQLRRSKMRTVWKDVLVSLVEARKAGEETTLWVQREVTDPVTGKPKLEALHQIPIKWIQDVTLEQFSTENKFHIKVYNLQDDFTFRCVNKQEAAQNWVTTLLSLKEVVQGGNGRQLPVPRGNQEPRSAVDEWDDTTRQKSSFDDEKQGPERPQYPQPPTSLLKESSLSTGPPRLSVKEMRAIAHGAGFSTVGMEKGELEQLVANIGNGMQMQDQSGQDELRRHQQQEADRRVREEEAARRVQEQEEAARRMQQQENMHPKQQFEDDVGIAGEASRRHVAEQEVAAHKAAEEDGNKRRAAEEEACRVAEEEQKAREEEELLRQRIADKVHRKQHEAQLQREEEESRRLEAERLKRDEEEEHRRRAAELKATEERRRQEERLRQQQQQHQQHEAQLKRDEEERRRLEAERLKREEEEHQRRVVELKAAEERRRQEEMLRQQQQQWQQQQQQWQQQQAEEAKRREQQAADERRRQEEYLRQQQAHPQQAQQQHWQQQQHAQQQPWQQQRPIPPPQHWQQPHPQPPAQGFHGHQNPHFHPHPPPNAGSPINMKYATMAHQTENQSSISEQGIKHAVLVEWALQPPMLQVLRPIEDLITSIHNTFPPKFGLQTHEYFTKWQALSLGDVTLGLAEGNRPDAKRLERAKKKLQLFLHTDKLPKDFTTQHIFLCRVLWDISNDAWNEYKSKEEELGWIR